MPHLPAQNGPPFGRTEILSCAQGLLAVVLWGMFRFCFNCLAGKLPWNVALLHAHIALDRPTPPQVALQDPGDEIIAHCASLKAGVAACVCLGDTLWAARDFPREYTLASYLKEPLPHAEAAQAWAAAAADPAQPLAESFVTHTAACFVELSRRAFVARKGGARGPGGARRGSSTGSSAAAQSPPSAARRGDEEEVVGPTVAVGIRIRENSSSSQAKAKERLAARQAGVPPPSVGAASSSSSSSSSASTSASAASSLNR